MASPCSLLSLSSRLDREWSDLLEIQLWCLLGSSNWWSWNSVSSKPVFNKQPFILLWEWRARRGTNYSVTLSDLLIKQLFPTSVTSGSFCSKILVPKKKKGIFHWYHNKNATEMKIETNIFPLWSSDAPEATGNECCYSLIWMTDPYFQMKTELPWHGE